MPTSKKRVIKEKPEVQVAVRNPLHSKAGKAVVIALAGAFVIGTLVSLIVVLISVAQR